MKKLRPSAMLLALLLLLAGTARAEPPSGFYAGIYLGVPVTESATAEDDLGRFRLETDPGALFAVTCGYDLPPGGMMGEGRLELEYAYRSNSYSEAKFSDIHAGAGGDLEVQSLLFNSFAVFANRSRVAPYLGVGIGGAQVRIDDLTAAGLPLIDDDDLVFAWQAGCGLQVELTPDLRFDLGYRYFATTHPEFTEASGQKVELEYAAHTGMMGLVYKF